MKKTIFIICTLFVSHFSLYSQVDCSKCNVALNSEAAKETFEQFKKSDFTSILNTLFSKDETFWTSYKENEQHEMDIAAAYEVYNASFSKKDFKSKSSQSFSNLKQFYSQNSYLKSSALNWIKSKTTNSAAYPSWIKCLELCNSNTTMVGWGVGDIDEGATIHLSWKKGPGSPLQPKLLQVIPNNIKIIDTLNMRKGNKIPEYSSLTMVCKRKNKYKDARVELIADNNYPSVNVPFDAVDTIPKEIPPYDKTFSVAAPFPFTFSESCNNCPNIKFIIPDNGFCDACGNATINIVNIFTQDGKLSKCDFTHLYKGAFFQFQNKIGKWFSLTIDELDSHAKTTTIHIKEIETGSYPNGKTGNYCDDFDSTLSKCGEPCK